MENSCGKPTVNMFSLEWGYRMRMKQIHRRILGAVWPASSASPAVSPHLPLETATPANADERRENPPGLESKAPETPEASEEVSLVLVTEIQNEDELLSPARFHPAP